MKFDNKTISLPSKIIIPILTLIVGAVFFYISFFEYGFWDTAASKPTKGFFPAIISVALILLSLLALVQNIRSEKVEYKLLNWYVPIAFLALVGASYVIGLVASIVIFEILWLKVYEKQSWKCVCIVLAIVLFIVVGCFQMWLGIDFPLGFILDAILG